MAMRWRKNPSSTGLARITEGHTGYSLFDGAMRFAVVYRDAKNNWFWVAGWDSGVPYRNTCKTPSADDASAKKEAIEYVRKHIKAGAKPLPNDGNSLRDFS